MKHVRFIWGSCFLMVVPSLTHAQTAELHVVGQASLQAQLTSQEDGSSIVAGRFLDETGSPLSGEVRVFGAGRRPLTILPCRSDATLDTPSPALAFAEDGHFCVHLEHSHQKVTVQGTAQHFLTVESELKNDGALQLPHPRFARAPQTLELGQSNKVVVEVLMGGGPGALIAGAELSLSVICAHHAVVIDSTAVVGNRLNRFEFEPSVGIPPGNCHLEARISAPGHESQVERRTILIRGLVVLTLEESREFNDTVEVIVQALTQSGTPVVDGIVEATSAGAHLTSAPVQEGRAHLIIERASTAQEVVLSFLPASPAYVVPPGLRLEVRERRLGLRWITIHSALLSLFCAWIVYAWLKPRPKQAASDIPPRRPFVQGNGREGDRISGRVRDAHTGELLPGVRLTLELPGVSESLEKEVTVSDMEGHFEFQTRLRTSEHLRLHAAASGYLSLRAPALGGEITVHMSELRREIVRRLIDWAKRAGPPWSLASPPTALEVEKMARVLGHPKEETWASRIADLAYQQRPPSEAEVVAASSPDSFERTRRGR